MSMAKKMGPKEAALRQVLDVVFGSLDGSAPTAMQAADVSLQETTPMEEEWAEAVDEAAAPREVRA